MKGYLVAEHKTDFSNAVEGREFPLVSVSKPSSDQRVVSMAEL